VLAKDFSGGAVCDGHGVCCCEDEDPCFGVGPADEDTQILSYLDRELGELEAAIALSRERRAALISAAVMGKIDVRGHGVVA